MVAVFHGFVLQPLLFAVLGLLGGDGLLTDLSYGLVAALFFLAVYLAQAVGTIRAWLGGKP